MVAQRAQIEFVLDISGSFVRAYRDNIIQDIVERLAPMALEFDDDGSMPVTLFGENSHQILEVTQANLCEYVNREVLKKYPLEGATKYAKPLLDIIQRHFGTAIRQTIVKKSNLFGKKKTETKIIQQSAVSDPVFVLFITDGNNQDQRETEQILRMMEVLPIFVQFVGVGNASFIFLRKLDEMNRDFMDNAGFFQVSDIVNTSDEQLYKDMLHEFSEWVKKMKAKELIKQQTITTQVSSNTQTFPSFPKPALAADNPCSMCKGVGGSCVFCKGTGKK